MKKEYDLPKSPLSWGEFVSRMSKNVATNLTHSINNAAVGGTTNSTDWSPIGPSLVLDSGRSLVFVLAICQMYVVEPQADLWVKVRIVIDGVGRSYQDARLDSATDNLMVPVLWVGEIETTTAHSIGLEWAIASGTGTVSAHGTWTLGALGWKR